MPNKESSSIEKPLILAKLSRLREYYGYLKQLQTYTLEDFIDDFKIHGATERFLQVSIECIIDIGNELISSLQLRRPERYRDIPYILAEARIIPKDFAETVALMIGLRNLLVHAYASINLKMLYEFLQEKIQDFEKFARHIAEWLEDKAAVNST